jgi:hypothetical protein
VFENWVLRRIFGPKEGDSEENCIMRSFIIWALHKILLGPSNQGE